MTTFEMIAKLEELEAQKKAGKLSGEEEKNLNGQLRNLRAELAKRGYTSEQQRPGYLAAWAIYVEMGPHTLRKLIEAVIAADNKSEGNELKRLNDLKHKIGIDDISFTLEEAVVVLGIINDRPTAVAARYMTLVRKRRLSAKEKLEKDALTARLDQLGINPSECSPLEWAIILANKEQIRHLLSNHPKSGQVIAERYTNNMRMTDLQEALETADDDDERMARRGTDKGTRARKTRKFKTIRNRSPKEHKAFERKLWKIGLPDTDRYRLQQAINSFDRAKRRRNDRRRRGCRTESNTIYASDVAVDTGTSITLYDKRLMDENPDWETIIRLAKTNPDFFEILANPSLRALAAEEM